MVFETNFVIFEANVGVKSLKTITSKLHVISSFLYWINERYYTKYAILCHVLFEITQYYILLLLM